MKLDQRWAILKSNIRKWFEERERQKSHTLFLFEKGLTAGNMWDKRCKECEYCDTNDGCYCCYWDTELEGEYDNWYERAKHCWSLIDVNRCSECVASEEFEADGFQSEKERRKFIWEWAWHFARGYRWRWNSKKKKGEWKKEKKCNWGIFKTRGQNENILME